MDPDELNGVFDNLENEERVDVPEAPVTEPKTETPEAESEKTTETTEENTKTETEESTEGTGETEKGNQATEGETETNTEPSKTETETVDEIDWESELPPPPPAYAGKVPELDEQGNITNMDPVEYENYMLDRADQRYAERRYNETVENAALDAAEKILPEIKTNPAIRQLVESTRVSSILNGQMASSYDAAKTVKEALGLSSTKLSEAKQEGANNAKTSITTQKIAAVGTGAGQTPADQSKSDSLDKRLAKGDDNAFEELFNGWQEEGKI